MTTQLTAAEAADILRSHSGEWLVIRRDRHNRIHALISQYRRRPPKALTLGRFTFRVKSAGHGTGETKLIARHMPVTIPINL